MKQRETNLINIVSQMYRLSYSPKLNFGSLSAGQYEELMSVYKTLGGCLDQAPVNFGSWDIVTDRFIIELDEEQHFNRYRKNTLASTLYSGWLWFDVDEYKAYCEKFEDICLKKAKRGGYWASDSTIRQFGSAGENGSFSGNGSPRWKQRAIYDYCRDLFGKVHMKPVYRFSIYDPIVVNGHFTSLGKALDQNMQEAVMKLLHSKIEK